MFFVQLNTPHLKIKPYLMPLPRLINLAIVDDHSLFRKTLKHYLSEQKNINVAVQAADILELLNKLKHSSIDVLLMDIFLPELRGNEALTVIRNEYPDIKILALSMCGDMNLISDLLDGGIHGYILKSEEPEELLQAIRVVADNRLYRNKVFTEALYWNKQNDIKTFAGKSSLTLNEREKKILQLIWEEKSNKEIADELFLGIRSVEKIRQDVKEKIGAKSTIGLLKYGINKKIISFDKSRIDG
jgi:DNA-binding NarL/FixJ family response regulator